MIEKISFTLNQYRIPLFEVFVLHNDARLALNGLRPEWEPIIIEGQRPFLLIDRVQVRVSLSLIFPCSVIISRLRVRRQFLAEHIIQCQVSNENPREIGRAHV